jgi:iron complex outermembrane recepter protein
MKFTRILFTLFFCLLLGSSFAQQILKGTIKDDKNGEPLVGATVVIKGTTVGTVTDFDGNFDLKLDRKLPVTLSVSFIGYLTQELEVKEAGAPIKLNLKTNETVLKEAVVYEVRISEKQKQAPLTVESMDLISIKETPAANFYEGLGNLKGVDLTSASLGFKVINTRGFNSTSPVRSLQIIDGVDNQSPGLNFSLGNFLGASELDVLKADLIVGASSAFYGPNAFNGVISMTTKSPFTLPGLQFQMKVGERNLVETAFRWAQAFQNKKGRDVFGYKLNLFWFQAYDWEATNSDPTINSQVGKNNPGGYDAVNRYGDENLTSQYNNYTSRSNQFNYPGLYLFHRTGYWEKDLVDYNTKNLKANIALHFKPTEKVEVIASSNFGYGTTVYQGDNRYNLKDILFFQNRLEVKQEGKFFIRFYATNEDAGKSFDAVSTAFALQDSAKNNFNWSVDYATYWAQNISNRIKGFPGFPTLSPGNPFDTTLAQAIIAGYRDSVLLYHDMARAMADSANPIKGTYSFFQPGTARFDSAYNKIKSTYFNGPYRGARLFDKSALYHIHGEYKLSPGKWIDITAGAEGRLYTPMSHGTIFSDTLQISSINKDANGNPTDTVYDYRKITNYQFGIYLGLEKKIAKEKIKLNATIRMDKNQNFNYLFSPAVSAVYNPYVNHTFRASFSAGIRNPTLADQYLYYNVGRAILLGNIDGRDSLVTVESYNNFLLAGAGTQAMDSLDYFNVQPIRPEKVKTFEVGYRSTLWNHVYVDGSAYFSWYKDFIGYKIGLESELDENGQPLSIQAYRIASNSADIVYTYGASIGINYFFKQYNIGGNYSWNVLNRNGSDDPLIPAFNTPQHKYNLSFSGRDIKNFGFSINYKWIQGFRFEGSPQFTGEIPSYDMVDAQINYKVPKFYCTFKLGASNLFGFVPYFSNNHLSFGERVGKMFDNRQLQVFGGPYVGRLVYFSVLLDLGPEMFKKKKK